MVALKCRTPGEAQLVLENLESAEVVALMPNYEEMVLQYENSGYVEVQIPADVYDSSPDLRAMVEFSTAIECDPTESAAPNAPTTGYTPIEKYLASLLGVLIVPGLFLFVWQLTHHREAGEEQKAKDLISWFFVGVSALVVIIIAIWVTS